MKRSRRIIIADPVKARGFTPRLVLLNGAAAVVVIYGLAVGLRTILFPPQAEACSKRYERSTVFAVERDGTLLTTEQVQGAVDGRDYGVAENLSVIKIDGERHKAAMVVKLGANSAAPALAAKPNGGISFPWSPQAFRGRSAACLGYSVFFPADFAFGTGGTLPGFVSEASGEAASTDAGFEIRPVWGSGGIVRASTYIKTDPVSDPDIRHKFDNRLPRGRWARVELEAVLNTPDSHDGFSRVWIDGHLVAEQPGLVTRKNTDVTLGNVVVDTYFSGRGFLTSSPKDQDMMLGPIELRWNP